MKTDKVHFIALGLLPFIVFVPGELAQITYLIAVYFIFRLIRFILLIGKSILIRELIELIFILQILLAPGLYYCMKEYRLIEWKFWYWPMKVDYQTYFSLAIPCGIAFIIGLFILRGFKKFERDFYSNVEKFRKEENSSIGFILTIVGLVAGLLQFSVPISLGFIFTLFSSFLYVGFLYIFYSFNPLRKMYLILILSYIMINGLVRGMLGDLIWWPLMIALLTAQSLKINPALRIVILFFGIILFSILQSVKQQYRQQTWRGNTENVGAQSNLTLLSNLSSKYTSNSKFSVFDWNNYFLLVDRLNLGVHVTNVMHYTPDKSPFAYGETIMNGFFGSLLPRLFWADKPQAGGHSNYKRFAGFSFSNSSMSIGIVGEGYANFDFGGTPFYIFGYGLLLGLFYKLIIRNFPKSPKIMFWIPYFFIHLIAAETDFFMTFNALLKSVLLIVVIFRMFPKLIKD